MLYHSHYVLVMETYVGGGVRMLFHSHYVFVLETYIRGGVEGEDDGTRAEGDDADAGLQVVLGLGLDGDLTLRPDGLGADRAPRLDDNRLLQSDLLGGQEAIVLQLICRRMTNKNH